MGSQPSTPRASPKPPKSDKKKDGKQEQGSVPRITSYIPKDVMISYSHQDKDMCQKLRGKKQILIILVLTLLLLN